MLFSSPFCYSNDLSSILSPGDIAMLFFHPSSRFVKDHVLFMPIHLTGVLCPFCSSSFSPYQALLLFSTEVMSEIFLTPCSIHSRVPEVVCCDFIKYLFFLSSSYSIPFLFRRSVAQIISFLILLYLVLTCSSFLTECFQFCSSPLYSFLEVVQPRKVHWFHSFAKEATLFYLFLFRFPSGAILDLGTRSSRSGGVL